jgi:hypothetical protein
LYAYCSKAVLHPHNHLHTSEYTQTQRNADPIAFQLKRLAQPQHRFSILYQEASPDPNPNATTIQTQTLANLYFHHQTAAAAAPKTTKKSTNADKTRARASLQRRRNNNSPLLVLPSTAPAPVPHELATSDETLRAMRLHPQSEPTSA